MKNEEKILLNQAAHPKFSLRQFYASLALKLNNTTNIEKVVLRVFTYLSNLANVQHLHKSIYNQPLEVTSKNVNRS